MIEDPYVCHIGRDDIVTLERIMATQILEDVFDTSLVDTWYDYQEEFDLEVQRANVNARRFKNVKVIGTSKDNLGRDVAMAKAIHADLASVVRRVEAGGTFSQQRFDDMLTCFSVANHVLNLDNDALDSAFAVGIGSLFVLLPWAALKRRAKKLKESLVELEKLLKQAKREQTESYGQAVINLAITGIVLATGPTSLLVLGGIAIGQMIVDDALGADTSAAATHGSQGNTTSGALSSAVESMEKVGKKGKKVAKAAGKATIVVGFVFDVNEIHTAHVNVGKLEAAMKQAEKDLKDLQADIKRHRPKIDAFLNALKAWERDMELISETAEDARYDLDRFFTSTGYYPS